MSTLRLSLFVLLLLSASNSWAVFTPLALTGDEVPGIPTAAFSTFGNAQLNAAGQAVFSASLQTGVGGVTTTNENVLVSFDEAIALLAQSGSGNVAGAPGTDYANFQEYKINVAGDILLKANLVETGDVTATNRQGYWRFSDATPSLITRTGTSAVPGAGAAKFFDLGARVGTAHTGDFAFLGQLDIGNGVNGSNDLGIWNFQGSSGSLIARENNTAPDVVGGLFNTFGAPTINSSNQIAFRATMKSTASITTSNRLGVWVFDNGDGNLIARAGSAGVPGSTSDFVAFADPINNESGQVAFHATLASGEQGLWLYNGTSDTNIALTNAVDVPGLPGASFTSLSKPLLTDSGQVVTLAGLSVGLGGVTAADDFGLWLFDEAEGDQLLAREGVGGVAGVVGASFDSFEHFAPVADTGIYVSATLQAIPGIVDSSNDEGIWHIPFDGAAELLVRKGDTLAGRTIVDLWLPAGQLDEAPLNGISNADGDLLFHATFTNGDSGLFLYSPGTATEFAAADFNLDGYVDQSDLAMWQGAYGTNAAGDADDDGDTDGADFLIWQRQYTGSAPELGSAAVPEPGVSLLLVIALVAAQARRPKNS
jgi:hypothetical protein